jgi:hypothetical protein
MPEIPAPSADAPLPRVDLDTLARPGSLGDPVAFLVGGLAAAGVAIGLSGGGARVPVELCAIGVACLAAYRFRQQPAVAPSVVVAVIATVEASYGRLSGHYWSAAVTATAAVLSVYAARNLRKAFRLRDDAIAEATSELAALHEGRHLEDELELRRPLAPIAAEVERSRRHNHQLSLLIVKPDAELVTMDDRRGLAAVIADTLRATDTPLAMASNFWIVLPETSADRARAVAERIRLSAAAVLGEQAGTVAIGAASFPADATSSEQLAERAGVALARAIASGGNRTVSYSLAPSAPPGWRVRMTGG